MERPKMAIHIHNLDKTELRSSLQKAKQISDNQGKLCFNKIILMETGKETTQKIQQIIKQ